MPIPNHCGECDKPLSNNDSWMCQPCQEKEDKKKNIVTANVVGAKLSTQLPSMKPKNEE